MVHGQVGRCSVLLITVYVLALWPTTTHQFNCKNIDCKNLQCEPLTCPPDYTVEPQSQIEYQIRVSDPCNCCSRCVKYKKEGDSCSNTTDLTPVVPSNQCLHLFESEICQKHLMCVEDIHFGISYKECERAMPCTDRNETYEAEEVQSDWFWHADCDKDGTYKPKQCKGNRCFCTSKTGERIFGNFIVQTYKKANCRCSLMEMRLKTMAAKTGEFSHVSCQQNGNYRPLQCMYDMCFCVNETNGEVSGTIVPRTLVDRLPCYNEKSFTKHFQTACQKERSIQEQLAVYYFNKGMKFEFLSIAQCDPDGTFVAKQCDIERCYCANPETGHGIAGYTVSSRSVEANEMNCYCLREMLAMSTDGGSLQSFDCNKNGNYKKLACHRNICYCLDRDGFRDSIELDVSPWYGKECEIKNKRLMKCYTKNDNIECKEDKK